MNYSNVKDFMRYLEEHKLGGPDTPQLENTDENLDENSGVAFPGNSIRLNFNQTFKDGENMAFGINPNLDLLVVE